MNKKIERLKDLLMKGTAMRYMTAALRTFERQQEESNTLREDAEIYTEEFGKAGFVERLEPGTQIALLKKLEGEK